MTIFAIGRNYVAHIQELNNQRPERPIVFTKPDTALLRYNQPFDYPDFSSDINYEVELVLRVAQGGKNIAEQQATQRHCDAIGIGIDFTARDWQNQNKANGWPWDIAKGFDGSAPLSDTFLPLSQFANLQDINFSLQINGQLKQAGNSSLMLFNFDYIVSYLSRFFTLSTGDLIFTGTPKGVGSVHKGDLLSAYIEQDKLLEFEVR